MSDFDKDGQHPFTLYCSFCGIWHEDIEHLIVGPGVSICTSCIEQCNEFVAGRKLMKKNQIAEGVKRGIRTK